ncbi:hypothetical protein [Kitasatospora sp. NPDC050467]|uniref:hypothetical protein n=2 Tax=Kitasatospora TaxID=2063 RepID=UPI003246F0AF
MVAQPTPAEIMRITESALRALDPALRIAVEKEMAAMDDGRMSITTPQRGRELIDELGRVGRRHPCRRYIGTGLARRSGDGRPGQGT